MRRVLDISKENFNVNFKRGNRKIERFIDRESRGVNYECANSNRRSRFASMHLALYLASSTHSHTYTHTLAHSSVTSRDAQTQNSIQNVYNH